MADTYNKIATVTTISGSVYLVNETKKEILRVGEPGQTVRAKDTWKTYREIFFSLGEIIIIVWPESEPLLEGSEKVLAPEDFVALPTTQTSPVKSITRRNVRVDDDQPISDYARDMCEEHGPEGNGGHSL